MQSSASRFKFHLKFVLEVTAFGGAVLHDIHTRALRRAAQILGGEDIAACYLGATEIDFPSWISQKELPRNIFLRLVDIITDEEVRRVAALRAALARRSRGSTGCGCPVDRLWIA